MASNNQSEITSPGDWRIPVVIAAVAWFASAIAVIGYTFIAFKETISGDGNSLDANPPGMLESLPQLQPMPQQQGTQSGVPQWEIKALEDKLGPPSPAAPQPKPGRRKLK